MLIALSKIFINTIKKYESNKNIKNTKTDYYGKNKRPC